MDPKIEAEILKMAEDLSVPAIAEEMGVSAQAIRNLLKRHEKAQGEKIPAPTNPQDVLIAEAYENGEEIPLILARFDIRRARLYSILSKFSVPTRQVQQKMAKDRAMDEAISLYEQGVVIRQITEDTGVHQPTLHAELARRRIPLRRPRE